LGTENVCVFTFHSTHQALEFEKVLKNNNYQVKLIPVPRQVSSSCGLAGRVNEENLTDIKNISDENYIEYDHIYRVYSDNKKPEDLY